MPSGKRIISDLRLFGRGYLRNTAGLFFGLIFPVILILIFGAIFSGNNTGKVTVYLQNQDVGPFPPPLGNASENFTQALTNAGTLDVKLVNASENFEQYLSDHSSSDGIIIPANFSVDYAMEKTFNVTVYGNPTQSSNAIVSGTVSGVINFFNLHRYGGSPIIGISPATVKSQAPKYIDFLVPGLIGFSILVSPMFSMVNISSEYKKNKLFKLLSLTPLTKTRVAGFQGTMVHFLVSAFLLTHGCRRNLPLSGHHHVNSVAHTISHTRANAVLFAGHAGWNHSKKR